MASANDQIYRQLKPTESRLVLLAPGNHNDPIICSLKYFDVLHPPPYEALSYVWGDPKITAPISIDGHNLQVTTNLEIALRHLRLEQATRILWIDAININQLDMNERAQQVAMMANIYRNADLVVVWLGPADEYTEMFFKLAKEKRGWRTLYSIKVAWSARAILLDLEKEDIQQRSICGSRRLHQARKIFVIHDFFWSLRHGALYFGQGLATLHLIQNEWFSR
ncbi:hypothetical protein P171DRAFT_347545 [Karstenula rhodostoma CBS 690.94]|uniref:Heterokaryon incompatibility domain-containing protein n=1 Tax=Karstenula rhodostoma CBS 690.94 TaxID=1392251 RepID=A0A9P4PZE5_9PLEO|nr:hypothetical protein P171DRAFT_347545 [Karstenula rhodostoma CBS 690.94]